MKDTIQTQIIEEFRKELLKLENSPVGCEFSAWQRFFEKFLEKVLKRVWENAEKDTLKRINEAVERKIKQTP